MAEDEIVDRRLLPRLRVSSDEIAEAPKKYAGAPAVVAAFRRNPDAWNARTNFEYGKLVGTIRDVLAPRTPSVYCYAIAVGDYVKIGKAADVASRLRELQVGCPFWYELVAVLPGGYGTETLLHRWLSARAVRNEWFEMPHEVEIVLRRLDREFSPMVPRYTEIEHRG